MRKKHIEYCLRTAHESGESGHPVEVMKSLGYKYQHATPQSINDTWWFWNCENVPDQMQRFLRERNWDPMEMVGFGLSQEMAERIRDYAGAA